VLGVKTANRAAHALTGSGPQLVGLIAFPWPDACKEKRCLGFSDPQTLSSIAEAVSIYFLPTLVLINTGNYIRRRL
jgi:hypothetical protein